MLLAIICWIAHFWYFRDFGLYEDDYGFIGRPLATNFGGVVQLVIDKFSSFHQGRPLGFSLAYILSYLSFHLGGLTGVYICGYLVNITNTWLFYELIFRLSYSLRLAVIGGLAFCLFPADTTATFLTHSLGVYCSIIFFLLATHAYISNKQWLAYLAITASVICYESCFLLFLAVPFLKYRYDHGIFNKLIPHTLILSLILATTITLRKILGESRMSKLDTLTAIGTSIKHTLLGPFISLGMYPYRALDAIFNLKGELFILVPICGLIIWLLFRKILANEHRGDERLIASEIVPRSQLWLFGVVTLFLAYPLTIILKVHDIDGRASRVHLAAIIGGSILFALLCDRLLSIAKHTSQKRLISIALATLFALLVGFGLLVQQDYRLAWSKQQNFWTEVTKLCPDMQEGTTILVERDDLQNPTQIMAYSWSMPVVLERIYNFPSPWQVLPRTYPIYPNWQQQIDNPDQLSLAKITQPLTFIPKQHIGVVRTKDVIMLDVIDGRLTRLDHLTLNSGITLNFKPRNPQAKIDFPHRPLYPYLIKNQSTQSSFL
jgi:hypothetical protein